jgi:hypothetical protein
MPNSKTLVKELREFGQMMPEGGPTDPLIEMLASAAGQAADRIEELEKAMEPFARAANFYEVQTAADDQQLLLKQEVCLSGALTARDFRRAAAIHARKAASGE